MTAGRRTLVLLVTPIAIATAAGTVGNALLPTLLRTHPLLLIGLDARNRQLLLVTSKVSFLSFMVVGTLRRFVSDPFFYGLGRAYGDTAIRWIEKRSGNAGGYIRTVERLFHRADWLFVLVWPGALVCTLAGATAMNIPLFVALNLVGTVAVVYLLWASGDIFQGPVTAVSDFISNNYIWLTALSVLLTAYYLWDQRRRGRLDLPETDENAS
jgi:membrane protein DedA with SNARE-associated domain